MKINKYFKLTLCIIVLFICTEQLFSDQDADIIIGKFYNLKEADNSYTIASMVLIDKNDNKKTRKIIMYTENTPKGENTFIEFLEPADVKGTKFLTLGNKDGDDDQRIYMPAFKKVRKISSSGKKGKFMGSDLYFYDMEDRDFNDATYKNLKHEVWNGRDFWVIETYPLDKNSPYSKTIVWVSKEDNYIYKRVSYDKKRKLLKTIVIVEVKKIKGIFIPSKMVVDNHKDKHKTLLIMDKIQVNTGIDSSIFTIQNLEK